MPGSRGFRFVRPRVRKRVEAVAWRDNLALLPHALEAGLNRLGGRGPSASEDRSLELDHLPEVAWALGHDSPDSVAAAGGIGVHRSSDEERPVLLNKPRMADIGDLSVQGTDAGDDLSECARLCLVLGGLTLVFRQARDQLGPHIDGFPSSGARCRRTFTPPMFARAADDVGLGFCDGPTQTTKRCL